MLTWITQPFVRIIVFFIAGILLRQTALLTASHTYWLAGTITVWIIAASLVGKPENLIYNNSYFGISFSMLWVLAGMSLAYAKSPVSVLSQFPEGSISGYTIVINSDPGIKNGRSRSKGKVLEVLTNEGSKRVDEEIWLNIKKPQQRYRYGDVLVVKGRPTAIQAPNNPFDFNYKAYSKIKSIFYQAYLSENEFRVIDTGEGNIIFLTAYNIRAAFQSVIDQHIDTEAAQQIVSSLVLGKKSELDDGIKMEFSNAGALHILAVSGLHVGIVFLILRILTSFFGNRKWEVNIKGALVLVGLWTYVFITGMPISAMRAAIMFSFFIVAKMTMRTTNSLNTIAAAAFAILVYDPKFIYDVGFQLSFTAVTGIVFFTPKIQDRIPVENVVLQYFRDLIIVSVVVQLCSLPFTLYHFHSAQLYTVLTNIIVIPAAFGIIMLSVFMFAFSGASVLANWSGNVNELLTIAMRSYIDLIGGLPGGLHHNIYFDFLQSLLTACVIVLIAQIIIHRKRWLYYMTSAFLAVLCTYSVGMTWVHSQQHLLVVSNTYNFKGFSIIDGLTAHHYKQDNNKLKDVYGDAFGVKNGYWLNASKHLAKKNEAFDLIFCNGHSFYIPTKTIRNINKPEPVPVDILIDISGIHKNSDFITQPKQTIVFGYKRNETAGADEILIKSGEIKVFEFHDHLWDEITP